MTENKYEAMNRPRQPEEAELEAFHRRVAAGLILRMQSPPPLRTQYVIADMLQIAASAFDDCSAERTIS